MTDPEQIADLTAKLAKAQKQITRLKERLKTKIIYEKGYLKATSATPQFVHSVELKDRAVLEEQ